MLLNSTNIVSSTHDSPHDFSMLTSEMPHCMATDKSFSIESFQ